MAEIWKDIKGYEGLYQVSNFGRIKSIGSYIGRNQSNKIWCCDKPEIIMHPEIINGNYLRVMLRKDGKSKHFLVHRLVAETFIPNPNNLPQINHKDQNPQNNVYTNLEWCTQRYNNLYGDRIDKVINKISKKIQCVETNVIYNSISDAYKALNKKYQGGISACCNNKAKTALGYHWKFIGGDINE